MKKTGEIIVVEPAIKPLGQRGGYAIGHLPVVAFETADTLKLWVQAMRKNGVSASTEAKAWKVLSSALSWAVEDDAWPLSTNGCLTMQRRRGMSRASRRAGTGSTRQASPGKRRDDLPSWALSPLAVERIRLVMLERFEQRSPLLGSATLRSFRCSTASACVTRRSGHSLSVMSSCRRATVREVLSYGALDAGKTEGATGPVPSSADRRAPGR